MMIVHCIKDPKFHSRMFRVLEVKISISRRKENKVKKINKQGLVPPPPSVNQLKIIVLMSMRNRLQVQMGMHLVDQQQVLCNPMPQAS